MKLNKLTHALCIAMLGIPVITSAQATNDDTNSESEHTGVDRIVVYGEKQERDIQDSPVSVAVLTEAQLLQSSMQSFNDVYNQMANVSTLRGGNEGLFTIRGVSVQGVTNNANSYTAGVYIDDIALDNLAIRYGVMGLWDVEQVEVYRGPQATLQGRNALNGAVYIRTKEPEYEWGGKARAYFGNYGTSRLSFAGGGALIEDELALRLSVDKYQSDGFVKNITLNDDDYAGFDRQTVRGKLLWEPAALEQLSVSLTFASVENDMGENPNVRLDDPYAFEAQSDYLASNDISADMAALKIGWEFSDNLKFTSITTIVDDEFARLDDFDSSADPGSVIDQTGESESFSQEFRMNFEADTISGIVGLYLGEVERDTNWDLSTLYPKADVANQAYAVLMAPAEFGGLGLDLATSDFIWSYIPTLIQVQQLYDSTYKIENKAIFGELTWQASENWSFTVGARFDDEQQQRDQVTVTSILDSIELDTSSEIAGFASFAAQQLLDVLQASLQGDSENVDTGYSAFLPKFVAQYAWSNTVDTAFSAQRGYRAGGSSVNNSSGEVVEFEPEYTWNYELSLRSMLMDGNLRLNANVFFTEWEDQQVDVSPSGDPVDTFIGNAGESELYGAEIELVGYVNEQFDWFANLGYVSTEFKTFTVVSGGDIVDYSGNEFVGAPNLTMAAGFNYEFADGFFLNMDANYIDDTYIYNTNLLESDARTLVNAKLGYQQDSWSVHLWATNLLDKEFTVVRFEQQPTVSTQDYATPGDPRMIGLSFSAEF